MIFNEDFARQEAFKYRPGQRVALKENPNVFDIIADYDPMMVPPISLVNDPKPRYPEELKIIRSFVKVRTLRPASRPRTKYPACRLGAYSVAFKPTNVKMLQVISAS